MINHSKKRREGKDQEQQGQAVTPEEEVQNAHVDPKRNHRPVVRFPHAREVTKTARVERRKRAEDFVILGHDERDADHERPSSQKKNKKETTATSRRGRRTQRCRWSLPENLSDSDLKLDDDEENSVGSCVVPAVMPFDDSKDSDSDEEVKGSRTRLDCQESKCKTDPALEAARDRNNNQIRRADQEDKNMIGKCLPESAEAFFPCRLLGPDDNFQASSGWISEIKQVAEAGCPVPTKPKFCFSTEKDDIKHNTALLKKHKCNMAEVLEAQKGSTVWHGSELRPVSQLAKTTGDHPTFKYRNALLGFPE